MSEVPGRKVIPHPKTYDQAAEQFRYVHDLKAGEVVGIEPTEAGDLLLLLSVAVPQESHGQRPVRAFRAHRQDLVDLARHILGKLDPVTNEQILARIRKLLEDQR